MYLVPKKVPSPGKDSGDDAEPVKKVDKLGEACERQVLLGAVGVRVEREVAEGRRPAVFAKVILRLVVKRFELLDALLVEFLVV